MGHVLKTMAWCLGRIYQRHRRSTGFLATAEELAQGVLAKGYDHQNGGPYKDYNRLTGAMRYDGITDTAKAWWQMGIGGDGGIDAASSDGRMKNPQMADGSLDFFMKYFADHAVR